MSALPTLITVDRWWYSRFLVFACSNNKNIDLKAEVQSSFLSLENSPIISSWFVAFNHVTLSSPQHGDGTLKMLRRNGNLSMHKSVINRRIGSVMWLKAREELLSWPCRDVVFSTVVFKVVNKLLTSTAGTFVFLSAA